MSTPDITGELSVAQLAVTPRFGSFGMPPRIQVIPAPRNVVLVLKEIMGLWDFALLASYKNQILKKITV